ncbi:restriction endonuclease subunit S [Ligilactobacillus ruminis]|uniref:restriction endonuclease subunit S n=1 Tax=Ligilactobacillus ruminis TaxID=1623 RepID=UPI003F994C17
MNKKKESKVVPNVRFKGFTDAWKQRKLGELGAITTGNTPSTSVSEYYSDDGMIWVTPTDISNNITYETEKKLSKLGQQVGRVVPKNTILVTCIASIGKNTMLGKSGSFNQQINGLTPNEIKYVPYFLFTESTLWSAQMKKSAAAGTMQIVNRTEFSELKTWITTYEEQKKIGAYFANLDRLITLHQQKITLLTKLKKAMLEKMFPKKSSVIPEIRFNGFANAWEQRKLSDVVDSVDTGKSKFDKEGSSGEYPILGSTSVIGYDDEYDYEGDFILTARVGANAGSLYRYAGKVKISDNTVFIQASQNIEFLYQLLIRFDIKRLSFGTGQPLVKASELKRLELMMPTDMEEQMRIGVYFKNLDHLITLHQRKLDMLKKLKSACLSEMFI